MTAAHILVTKVPQCFCFSAVKSGKSAWHEGGQHLRDGAKYVEDNYGDVINSAWKEVSICVTIFVTNPMNVTCDQVKCMAHCAWDQVVWAWRQVLPHLKTAWEASKPYFHQLGKVVI